MSDSSRGWDNSIFSDFEIESTNTENVLMSKMEILVPVSSALKICAGRLAKWLSSMTEDNKRNH